MSKTRGDQQPSQEHHTEHFSAAWRLVDLSPCLSVGIGGEEVNFEFSRLNSCRNPSISIGIPQNAEALHLALPFDKLRAGFRCAQSRSVQDDKNYLPFFGTAEPGASENVGADAELFATAREMLQA